MATNPQPTTYISSTDTAKLIRQALKREFPAVSFSVRSHTYSGGSSIDVHWTDGPTVQMVEAVTNYYQGATFDGQIDLKSYISRWEGGEKVCYGVDWILTHRNVSRESMEKAIAPMQKD